MATDKFADFVRAVNKTMAIALNKVFEIYKPVIRAGEVYSQAQLMYRLGVGHPAIKSWESRGLPFYRNGEGGKHFYRGDGILRFLEEQEAEQSKPRRT